MSARLREWIAEAAPGSQLPSTRSLVAEYQASPVTVQKALQTLTAQGLIESRPGVGTFVRAVRTARPSDYGWQTAALRSPLAPLPSRVHTMRTCAERRHRLPLRLPGPGTPARAPGAGGAHPRSPG